MQIIKYSKYNSKKIKFIKYIQIEENLTNMVMHY